MIPIIQLGNFILFVVYLFITILTYFSYRKRKIDLTRYFLKSFIVLTVWFFFISLPGFVLNTPNSTAFIFLCSYIWVYVIMAHFILILTRFLVKSPKIEKILLFLVLVSLVYTIIYGLIKFAPSHKIIEGGFLYWIPGFTIAIRMPIGLICGSLGLIMSYFFFITGIRSGNRNVLKRATLLGGGFLILVLAGAFNYIVGANPSIHSSILIFPVSPSRPILR